MELTTVIFQYSLRIMSNLLRRPKYSRLSTGTELRKYSMCQQPSPTVYRLMACAYTPLQPQLCRDAKNLRRQMEI